MPVQAVFASSRYLAPKVRFDCLNEHLARRANAGDRCTGSLYERIGVLPASYRDGVTLA